METYELVLADPAKNITLLVLTPVPAEDRAAVAVKLLAHPSLRAEQAGFAVPPHSKNALGRLEMMGGEFCGNAARSFGLYMARAAGLRNRRGSPGQAQRVLVECSGAENPVPVRVNLETGWAEAEIPPPLYTRSLAWEGRVLPVCVFPGITHLIAPGIEPGEKTFFALKRAVEAAGPPAGESPDALGVLFLETPEDPGGEAAMTPAVYVYKTGSLVFESSCGSGSAAVGIWKSRDLADGEARYRVRQRGGTIEVRVVKRGGLVETAAIGGPVTLRPLTLPAGTCRD
ncbi:MAG: hypothetical protein LBG84_01920 [Treponema sp.]|nr:hypothetical protein [Treponema sp.]